MGSVDLDVDLTDGTFYACHNARETYRWMRSNGPVFRDRNGLVGLTTYRAVLAAERDPQLFSSAGGSRPEYPPMSFLIDMDDPQHQLRRKLVSAGFTRKGLRERVTSIGGICDTLIDAVCERGECDFVRDLAAPLPMIVIGDMLGVAPQDHDMLLSWSDTMMTVGSHLDDVGRQNMMDAFTSFNGFCFSAMAKRRDKPSNDLISTLVHAEVDGCRLSEEEIVMETLLILIGGDETTRHTLSGGTAELLRHPEQWSALLGDSALLPGAVEEMLRWTTPAKNMCRTVTADTEFFGDMFLKGEKVLLLFESANFDDAEFGDPDDFRIDRSPNNHLAFGFGPHFCLGNQLARTEIVEMLRRILLRLPDIRVAAGAELSLRPSNNVTGIETMPVAFSPTRPISSA